MPNNWVNAPKKPPKIHLKRNPILVSCSSNNELFYYFLSTFKPTKLQIFRYLFNVDSI